MESRPVGRKPVFLFFSQGKLFNIGSTIPARKGDIVFGGGQRAWDSVKVGCLLWSSKKLGFFIRSTSVSGEEDRTEKRRRDREKREGRPKRSTIH